MLHGGNIVPISQQSLAEPHLPILDVCLMVTPAPTPDVQQIPHPNPVTNSTSLLGQQGRNE